MWQDEVKIKIATPSLSSVGVMITLPKEIRRNGPVSIPATLALCNLILFHIQTRYSRKYKGVHIGTGNKGNEISITI